MREELRDPLRLDHIKDAIERLVEFDESCPLENIDEKDIRYYGAVKLLEIIGEAVYLEQTERYLQEFDNE